MHLVGFIYLNHMMMQGFTNPKDATVSQVYYLTFICGSTCFGCLPTHHQERTTALGASGFTVGEQWLERCLVVVWSVMRKLRFPITGQTTTKLRSSHCSPTVKPEDPSAVVRS